ncbi:phosphatase PAP2 family protein [Mucilaginibacter gilvus]|uniref:Phosphatase PAP2 family protein n=1 Tax=Mucilaginibacter gilvus TaxID=2305909 RepID=A0A3S3UGV5_9SPHI|nr:phosphatase PAP2 family protein [Mucilaginibacter gilvus]RWY46060.1 phosphatase PAP2 family protein [Mucilaginibacter gilvus]
MKIKLPDFNKGLIVYLLSSITIGFLLLTAFVLIDPLSNLDLKFSGEIQEHSNHPLDMAMKGVSWFGYMPNAVFLVIIAASLFFIFKYKREALFTILTLLSGLASSIIKFLVNRPRPLPSLVNILEKTRQQSFPSGHVVFYIVFFGFLILLMFRLSAINKIVRLSVSGCSLLLIFAVPVSRIYLGAHWFTDVLGGLLLGLLCLYLLSYFYLNPVTHRSAK